MAYIKSSFILLLALILAYFLNNYFNTKNYKNIYAGLNVVELINKFGYPLEIHTVITDDGYILTLHRIPHGRRKSKNENPIPIFFMHGAMNSGAEFITSGPEKALSLLLADRGHDIWLANARGTRWSRNHTKLDPDKNKEEFWDFSLHEIAVFDLPACIDYILKKSGQNTLHYVTYSQGSALFFIMASEREEYVKKVRLMTALGPALYQQFSTNMFITAITYFLPMLKAMESLFNKHEVYAHNGLTSFVMKKICNENSIFVNLCLHGLFFLHGYDFEQVNMTALSTVYSNLPAGCSAKQMFHLAEIGMRFARYDYGTEKNLLKYGQEIPPLYNISKTTNPVALYYSLNDGMTSVKDVENLIKDLPNVVKKYIVPYDKFNHNDFLHAIDVVELLYNSVIEEIEKY